MSVNPMGPYNPLPARGYAALYPEDPAYQKVVRLVKEYDFNGARAAANEVSDPERQWDAKRLIDTTAENFLTAKEFSPLDFL